LLVFIPSLFGRPTVDGLLCRAKHTELSRAIRVPLVGEFNERRENSSLLLEKGQKQTSSLLQQSLVN
jgi:hypothetical protein